MAKKEMDIEKIREKRKSKKGNKKPAMLICVVAVLLVIAVLAFLPPATYNKIYKNVSVAGISVGGMTYEEAQDVLNENFSELVPEIKVSAKGETKEIDFNIIAEYDIEKTSKNAFEYGRKDIFSKFAAYYFGKKDIPLETIVNKDALTKELTDFQNLIEAGYSDTSFKIEDDILVVTAGKSGSSIDVEKLTSQILAELENGKSVDVEAAVTVREFKGIDIDKLYDDVYCEPQNAYYDEENSKMVTHKIGYTFDKAKAEAVLKNADEGETFRIQLSVTYPDVTEEVLTGKMFSDTLASYSTNYNAGDVNRSHNLYLASTKVNGTVIAPGEVFSYNDVVGERTVAKGYRNAKVYEGGRVVDGLAGGICQVSTTIYNAALYSNMEIVERRNHSFPVAYAPMGQDATVSMGTIDFRFRNNSGYPIKIVSSVGGGICSVTILGTDKNHYKIEIQNSVTGTTPRSVEYENDTTLKPGEEKVKQAGSDGYTIVSRRIVRKNGEIVKNESIPSSYYIPLKKIILRNEEAEKTEEHPEGSETENPEAEGGEAANTEGTETQNPQAQPGTEPTVPEENTPSNENTPDNSSTSAEPSVPAATVTPAADTPPAEQSQTPSYDIPGITPEADPNTGV